MNYDHPDDGRLAALFEALDPEVGRIGPGRARVLDQFEAHHTSLLSEWLTILRVRPFVNTAWVLTATALLLFVTPIGPLLMQLLRS